MSYANTRKVKREKIGDGLMVPVDFEIMKNEKEDATKLDCKMKAAKRLLKRIKQAFP